MCVNTSNNILNNLKTESHIFHILQNTTFNQSHTTNMANFVVLRDPITMWCGIMNLSSARNCFGNHFDPRTWNYTFYN